MDLFDPSQYTVKATLNDPDIEEIEIRVTLKDGKKGLLRSTAIERVVLKWLLGQIEHNGSWINHCVDNKIRLI